MKRKEVKRILKELEAELQKPGPYPQTNDAHDPEFETAMIEAAHKVFKNVNPALHKVLMKFRGQS